MLSIQNTVTGRQYWHCNMDGYS